MYNPKINLNDKAFIVDRHYYGSPWFILERPHCSKITFSLNSSDNSIETTYAFGGLKMLKHNGDDVFKTKKEALEEIKIRNKEGEIK